MASRNLSNSLFSPPPQSITIMQFFCRRTNVTEFACGLPWIRGGGGDARGISGNQPLVHDEQKVTAKRALGRI